MVLPQRNPNFTGREDILAELRVALTSGLVAGWKQALTGLDGTGKSQIAMEYAYRHKEEYKFIWLLQSEEPAALASNYAGLAKELDLPEKSCADQTAIIVAVKRWLGDNSNWLLIFDNAKGSDDIEQYLPREGTGHIIITSRNPNWGRLAGVLPIHEQRSKILKRGKPTAYPDTIATTWDISLQAIKNDFPKAIDLLRLFAFLAPDNIPRSLLIEGSANLPEPLSSVLQDGIKLNDAVAALRRYSLINVTDDMFSVHRLVQAVTLDELDEKEKKKMGRGCCKTCEQGFPL